MEEMRKDVPRHLALFALVLLVTGGSVHSPKTLSVVTTLPDLRSITEEIGGDRVDVISIATGYQNPHFVDPKPSHILKLSRADMFVTVGLDLTLGWVPPLLTSSRNARIQPGAAGYVDTSIGVPLLQIPSSVSRERGDIHIFGNPHYWLDPVQGHRIAQNIHDALVRLQPEDQDYFTANLQSFNLRLDTKISEWKAKMLPFQGTTIIAYHNQWPYFEAAFGLEIAEFLEPRPGIPPTPSQLAKVIRLMQQEEINVIIISPYYKPDAAELVARNVNGKVVIMASSVDAFPEVKTYFDLFDYNVNLMIEALDSSSP